MKTHDDLMYWEDLRLPIFKQRFIEALGLVKESFATDFSELGFPSGYLNSVDSFTWEKVTCHLAAVFL